MNFGNYFWHSLSYTDYDEIVNVVEDYPKEYTEIIRPMFKKLTEWYEQNDVQDLFFIQDFEARI